jgi:glycosyltransferase involved in cell wall biosynthesis
MDKISLSTVVPVYSGQAFLVQLVAELAAVREALHESHAPVQLIEAIFVNDAAIDNSAQVLEKLAAQYSWIRVITLAKNFGQHPATIAGILHTSGDWVVTLDEDLQHRPEHILTLLRAAVTKGADIVYARPVQAVHKKAYRDVASRMTKRFLVWTTGNKMVRYFNSFRLIRGTVARSAASVCGHETFFDIALSWFSCQFTHVELVLEDSRFISTGQSGYTLRKLLSHFRRLSLSSQPKFLRYGAGLGFISVLVAIFLASKTLYGVWFLENTVAVPGWSSLFISILFFGGICALLIGIMLEYLTNIVLHTQGKPVFFQVDRGSDKVLRDYFATVAQ